MSVGVHANSKFKDACFIRDSLTACFCVCDVSTYKQLATLSQYPNVILFLVNQGIDLSFYLMIIDNNNQRSFLLNKLKCRGEHNTQLQTEADMCQKCTSSCTGDGKNFTLKRDLVNLKHGKFKQFNIQICCSPPLRPCIKTSYKFGKFGYLPKLIVSLGLSIWRDGANCRVRDP